MSALDATEQVLLRDVEGREALTGPHTVQPHAARDNFGLQPFPPGDELGQRNAKALR